MSKGTINSMWKRVIPLFLLLLIWNPNSFAQSEQTVTSSDGAVTLTLPATWQVYEQAETIWVTGSGNDHSITVGVRWTIGTSLDPNDGPASPGAMVQNLGDSFTETIIGTRPAIMNTNGGNQDMIAIDTGNPSAPIILITVQYSTPEARATFEAPLNALLLSIVGETAPDAVPEPEPTAPAAPTTPTANELVDTLPDDFLPDAKNIHAELEQPADCSGFALAVESAQTFDDIAVTGFLPEILDTLENRIYMQSVSGDIAETWMVKGDYGELGLVIPFHPTTPYEGGAVTVHVESPDGRELCPPQPFTILPLTERAGAFDDYVASVGDMLALEREAAGVTLAFLRVDNPEPLPLAYLPLVIAQAAYDEPLYPNSVMARYERGDYDMRMMDAIVATSGLDAVVAVYVEQRRVSLAAQRPHARTVAYQQQGGYLNLEATFAQVPIETYEQLEDWMEKQMATEGMVDINTHAGTIWANIGLVLTFAGEIPVYGTIFSLMGDAHLASSAVMGYYANLLPNRVTDLEYQMVNPIMQEDDINIHQVQNIQLSAASKEGGWDVSWLIADIASNIGGKVVPDAFGGYAFTGFDIGSNLAQRNSTLGSPGVVIIGPYEWTGIRAEASDVDDFGFIDPNVPAMVADNPDFLTYRALNATDTSRVYLAFNLPGQSVYESENVETVELIVEIIPEAGIDFDMPVKADSMCFEAHLEQVNDTSFSWRLSGVGIDETVQDLTPWCFSTPRVSESVSLSPCEVIIPPTVGYQVTLRSLADKGPRDPNYNPAWEERVAYFDFTVVNEALAELSDSCSEPPLQRSEWFLHYLHLLGKIPTECVPDEENRMFLETGGPCAIGYDQGYDPDPDYQYLIDTHGIEGVVRVGYDEYVALDQFLTAQEIVDIRLDRPGRRSMPYRMDDHLEYVTLSNLPHNGQYIRLAPTLMETSCSRSYTYQYTPENVTSSVEVRRGVYETADGEYISDYRTLNVGGAMYELFDAQRYRRVGESDGALFTDELQLLTDDTMLFTRSYYMEIGSDVGQSDECITTTYALFIEANRAQGIEQTLEDTVNP